MRFALTPESEDALELLAATEPEQFELVIADLEIFEVLGFEALDVSAMQSGLARFEGPTSRVSYWCQPADSDDICEIIAFMVH